jgi:hypothetical protein
VSFQNLMQRVNTTTLSQFSEPVTLEYGISSVTAQAVVDATDPNAELLLPGAAHATFILTMAAADAGQVTPDWTVIVQGKRREVLANPPAHMGLSLIYLGDAMGDN